MPPTGPSSPAGISPGARGKRPTSTTVDAAKLEFEQAEREYGALRQAVSEAVQLAERLVEESRDSWRELMLKREPDERASYAEALAVAPSDERSCIAPGAWSRCSAAAKSRRAAAGWTASSRH